METTIIDNAVEKSELKIVRPKQVGIEKVTWVKGHEKKDPEDNENISHFVLEISHDSGFLKKGMIGKSVESAYLFYNCNGDRKNVLLFHLATVENVEKGKITLSFMARNDSQRREINTCWGKLRDESSGS